MFQNIKVDIIYYKTPTDFEMEFNLSGCCRMRLLTDKAPDRKILVNQLVRAVGRSKIIMLTGALFGENGIIETCSKAISHPTVTINNKQFGISSEDEIKIIKDALPLVTTDGIFAGCIIEQGPQTLILLSENKNVRKNVMQNLIHQYIKEVCAAEMTEKEDGGHIATEIPPAPIVPEAESDAESETEETEPTEEALEETELVLEDIEEQSENSEETSEETEELAEALLFDEDGEYEEDLPDTVSEEDEKLAEEIIDEDESYLDDAMKATEEDIQKTLDEGEELVFDMGYIDRRQAKRITHEYANGLENHNSLVAGAEDYEYNEAYGFFSKKINIPILILTILLIIVAAVLCYCIFIVPTGENLSTAQQLKEIFETLFG